MSLRAIAPCAFGQCCERTQLPDLSLDQVVEQARLRYIGGMRGSGPRIDVWRPGRYRIRFGLAGLWQHGGIVTQVASLSDSTGSSRIHASATFRQQRHWFS